MGFTSAGTHTSIATTTGSQSCLIMADKDGCISSQSTLRPILIQSLPNTLHTIDPFPHKLSLWDLQVFLSVSTFLLISSFLSLWLLLFFFFTTQMNRNAGHARTGVRLQCGSRCLTIARPNNYILSTNIWDSSNGTEAKTIPSHASSLFLVSPSFCPSCFPFSIWLQLLTPWQSIHTLCHGAQSTTTTKKKTFSIKLCLVQDNNDMNTFLTC